MNWEDIVKRQPLMRFSKNPRWNNVKDEFEKIDSFMNVLERKGLSMEAKEIEDRWINRIISNAGQMTSQLRALEKVPKVPKTQTTLAEVQYKKPDPAQPTLGTFERL